MTIRHNDNTANSRQQVPRWRLVFWGVVAALTVSGLAVYLAEPLLFYGAVFAGLAIGSFGFFLCWSQQSGWAARHFGKLLLIYVILQTLLILWRLLESR